MKTRSLVLMAAVSLLAAVPATARGSAGTAGGASSAGGAARSTSNTQTYADSTGEDPAAPDVTGITVSNNDAGAITFQVNVANRPALTPDMLLDIYVDSDKNPATGAKDIFGADYDIELQPGSINLFQWDGSTFAGSSPQSSLTFSYTATGATIRISSLQLGKTVGFNFAVDMVSGIVIAANGDPDFTNAHDDFAPDPGHGTNAYQVLTKLVLRAIAFSASPSPATAGKPFSAGLAVTENDTNSAVKRGTVTCSARIAGTQIVAKAHRIVDGVASCVWSIPKTAKGKTIRGTVVLMVRGAQVSRAFSAKIANV